MSGRWLSSPMFRVVGQERRPSRGEATCQSDSVSSRQSAWADPEFRLVPTQRYYGLVTCGVLFTIAPLLARSIPMGMLASLELVFCASFFLLYLWRVDQLRERLGNRADLVFAIPFSSDKRQAATWLLTVIPVATIALGFTLRTAMNLTDDWRFWEVEIGKALPIALPIGCLLCWAGFCFIWTSISPSFKLPELEGAYRSVSQTVKEKIKQTTKSESFAPVSTWRFANNIAQDTHLYGQAVALFSVDVPGVTWKRSLRALIWYYGPVTVPCLILILTPLLVLVLQSGLDDSCTIVLLVPERFELALAALAWACWSMAFFIVFSEKDFGSGTAASTDRAASDVDVFQLGEMENRRVLREYVSDRGQLAMQILVLAITPMLMGYFGLFPEPQPSSGGRSREVFERCFTRKAPMPVARTQRQDPPLIPRARRS